MSSIDSKINGALATIYYTLIDKAWSNADTLEAYRDAWSIVERQFKVKPFQWSKGEHPEHGLDSGQREPADMTDKALLWILNDKHLWQMIDDIADEHGNMNIFDAFPDLHRAIQYCLRVNEGVTGTYSIEWLTIQQALKPYVISRR